jgi:plasmid maintenance system antidote protein VapI
MILCLKDPKGSTKKLLYLVNTFGKIVGFIINIQKSIDFQYTNNDQDEKEIEKITPFIIDSTK